MSIMLFNENTTINPCQANEIRKTAFNRVKELLGEDLVTNKIYFRYFITRLYVDAKKNSVLGYKFLDTKLINFELCMEYIMNWYPSEGIEKFKQSIDNCIMKRSLA